jgi:hypothetical protein
MGEWADGEDGKADDQVVAMSVGNQRGLTIMAMS